MTDIIKGGRCRCRCSRKACQSRRTLPKHPTQYVRPAMCRQCRRGRYRPDVFRHSGREHAGKVCRCDNYSFPHARGRGYCTHSPKLTAESMRDRFESRAWA